MSGKHKRSAARLDENHIFDEWRDMHDVDEALAEIAHPYD